METVTRVFRLPKSVDDAFRRYCEMKERDPNELVAEVLEKVLGLKIKHVKTRHEPSEEGGLVRVGEVKKEPAQSTILKQRSRRGQGRRGQDVVVPNPSRSKTGAKAQPKTTPKKASAKPLKTFAKKPSKKKK